MHFDVVINSGEDMWVHLGAMGDDNGLVLLGLVLVVEAPPCLDKNIPRERYNDHNKFCNVLIIENLCCYNFLVFQCIATSVEKISVWGRGRSANALAPIVRTLGKPMNSSTTTPHNHEIHLSSRSSRRGAGQMEHIPEEVGLVAV